MIPPASLTVSLGRRWPARAWASGSRNVRGRHQSLVRMHVLCTSSTLPWKLCTVLFRRLQSSVRNVKVHQQLGVARSIGRADRLVLPTGHRPEAPNVRRFVLDRVAAEVRFVGQHGVVSAKTRRSRLCAHAAPLRLRSVRFCTPLTPLQAFSSFSTGFLVFTVSTRSSPMRIPTLIYSLPVLLAGLSGVAASVGTAAGHDVPSLRVRGHGPNRDVTSVKRDLEERAATKVSARASRLEVVSTAR